MTRFFMSLNQATDLVLNAMLNGKHGDLFVYYNKSCTIEELAKLFSDHYEVIGNRCEEKTDEALLTINELKHSTMGTGDNIIKVSNIITNLCDFNEPFTSDNAERLTREELEEMLEDWRKYNETSSS